MRRPITYFFLSYLLGITLAEVLYMDVANIVFVTFFPVALTAIAIIYATRKKLLIMKKMLLICCLIFLFGNYYYIISEGALIKSTFPTVGGGSSPAMESTAVGVGGTGTDVSRTGKTVVNGSTLESTAGAGGGTVHVPVTVNSSGTFEAPLELVGKVLSVKEKDDGSFKFVLKEETQKSKILLDVKGFYDDPLNLLGNKIILSTEVSIPKGPNNPKTFDYQKYLKSKRIAYIGTASADGIKYVWKEKLTLQYKLAKYKKEFIQKIMEGMNEKSAGMLIGMLTGEKTYLDDDLYEQFQKNGTAHILAVSGIHVGILYAFIVGFLSKKRQRKLLYNAIIVLFLFIYAAIADFSPSIIRASLMIITHMFAKLTDRPYDLTASACFTGMLLLLINPFYILSLGFILSYTAIFVLAVIFPPMQRFFLPKKDPFEIISDDQLPKIKLKNAIINTMLPVIAIQIGMIPITLYCFNYFSLSAFIINIPVIFLAGIIIPLGILLMIFGNISNFLFEFMSFCLENLSNLLIMLNSYTAVEGMGYFNLPSPDVKWIIAYYVIIFFVFSEESQILVIKKRKKNYIAVALVFLLVAFLAFPDNKYDKADITFVDVGQGDCIFIKAPNGKSILIDGGGSSMGDYDVGKKVLYPYLMKNGVGHIDIAIISHLHADHFKGIQSLSNLMKIKNLMIYEGYKAKEVEILDEISIVNEKITYLSAGDIINVDKNLAIKVLHPGSSGKNGSTTFDEKDENKNTVVLKIIYNGFSVFTAGDIGFEGEDTLIATYRENPDILDSDVYKVSHHGSKYSSSTEFVSALSPKIAVIQVGKNNFGHPTKEVLDELSSQGIKIYRNDKNGAVMLDIRKNGKAKVMIMREN